jgi:acyl-CoA thioesterase I
MAMKTMGRLRGNIGKLRLICVAGCSLVWASAAHAVPLSPSCSLPDKLLVLNGGLDQTIDRLQKGPALRILAIGSSSTAGAGASTPQHTYPALLENELEERFPERIVKVDNLGINGEVASSTIARMRTEVAARDPDLVIWQLGTNDALTGVKSEIFRNQVLETLAWLQQRDVDVILMNPQLFPKIEKNQTYADFVDSLAALALEHDVPVLNRFAAMQYWNTLPPDVRQHMLWRDEFHMNDQGYACVAEMLAESIHRRAVLEAKLPRQGLQAVPVRQAGNAAPAVVTVSDNSAVSN